MTERRDHVVVVGASGLVGNAVVTQLLHTGDVTVTGVSRRPPVGIADDASHRFTHHPIDLLDPVASRAAFSNLADATHLVYAAVWEDPDDAVAGWTSERQMTNNLAMLENSLGALVEAGAPLRHVTLLQGTKAYGAHIFWPRAGMSTPAREREPRVEHENFYWLQEDYLKAMQVGADWAHTIWRPQLIYGDAIGSNLSVLPVIVAWAVMEREAGRPLCFPGADAYPTEAIDTRMLARAIEWGQTAQTASNETFNITNGDVYTWPGIWSTIADELGMEVGPRERFSFAELMPARAAEWDALREKHGMPPFGLTALIGGSASNADFQLGTALDFTPVANLVSTVKLRRAGFTDAVDTEDMFREWIARYRELGYIP